MNRWKFIWISWSFLEGLKSSYEIWLMHQHHHQSLTDEVIRGWRTNGPWPATNGCKMQWNNNYSLWFTMTTSTIMTLLLLPQEMALIILAAITTTSTGGVLQNIRLWPLAVKTWKFSAKYECFQNKSKLLHFDKRLWNQFNPNSFSIKMKWTNAQLNV